MRQPSEEEIAALEAELEKLTVDDVLLQTVVTLLNLGARKAGLAEGATADLPQVKEAIDACRALLPILEPRHGEQLGPVRDALSRLEMAYVQKSGGGGPAAQEPPQPEQPGATPQEEGPGPAQRSGRLWVPGQ
jgi:hypothetical protein